MRFVPFVLILGLIVAACGPRDPAYSNMQPAAANRSNSQTGGQSVQPDAPAGPANTETAAVIPSPGEADKAQAVKNQLPSFLDPVSGQIRDLPNYPKSTRSNFQYGPISGVDTAIIVLQTGEPMEKLTAFYDREIKKHGWSVVSNTRDPEHYRWELKKGELDEAVVEIRKTDQFRFTGIALTRAKRPETN